MVSVLEVIGAVGAPVHTIVRQVKRGKHHDAVAVELLFNLFGQPKDSFDQIGLIAFEQQGCSRDVSVPCTRLPSR